MSKLFLAIAIIILSVFLIWLMSANFQLFQKRKEAQEQAVILSERVANLEESREVVEQSILKGRTLEYLEKTAREELNFQKPGEKVVAFPISQTKQSTTTPAVPQKSPWQRLKDLF